MRVYVIGSLRNKAVPQVAEKLREAGFGVFDDWFSAGPEADDSWQKHQRGKGMTYRQALEGPAAQHVFRFDKAFLDDCDVAVLVAPAGKSGHLELGYVIGQGKPGFILMEEEPERWDVMANFATDICDSVEDLINAITFIATENQAVGVC